MRLRFPLCRYLFARVLPEPLRAKRRPAEVTIGNCVFTTRVAQHWSGEHGRTHHLTSKACLAIQMWSMSRVLPAVCGRRRTAA
jgi:hypothetical protein